MSAAEVKGDAPARVAVTDAGWAQLWVHGVHIQSGYGQGAKECCEKLAAQINANAARGVAGTPAPTAAKPMQGLAAWLRTIAETQAADAEQEACMLQWAREVDAACGVAIPMKDQK